MDRYNSTQTREKIVDLEASRCNNEHYLCITAYPGQYGQPKTVQKTSDAGIEGQPRVRAGPVGLNQDAAETPEPRQQKDPSHHP